MYDADLADHERGEKRTCHAAELERPQFDRADRVSDDQRRKDREFRAVDQKRLHGRDECGRGRQYVVQHRV